MKKTIMIVALAMVMLFAFSSIAFAALTDSLDTVEGVAGLTQSPTDSAHGGYAQSTNSCKLCHDVHQNANGHLFLAATTSAGCYVCHVSGVGSVNSVYTGTAVAHDITDGVLTIPDSGATYATDESTGVDGLTCMGCHDAAPHGKGFAAGGYALTKQANHVAFCVKCHKANDGRVVGGLVEQPTHVMALVGTTYVDKGSASGIGAADSGATSADCINCHTNGGTASVLGTDFPHTGTFKLLMTGATAQGLAPECLACHSGVGSAY